MRVVVHSAAIQGRVGYAIAETIERHDRTRFEVLSYSYGPDDSYSYGPDDASGLRRRVESVRPHRGSVAPPGRPSRC
jgi:hypothetical protein